MSEEQVRSRVDDDQFMSQEDDEDTQVDKYLVFQTGDEGYGIPISHVKEIVELQKITGVPEMPDFIKGVMNLRGLVIHRSRPDLHARIAHRTHAMLENGAIHEVEALAHASENCQKAIGVREIRGLLAGDFSRAACEELINAATRQYAKRQESWFRRELWLQPHASSVAS